MQFSTNYHPICWWYIFHGEGGKNSVDSLMGILHKFGVASGLEINWHRNIAYWWGRERLSRWVRKYQWKWATNIDLSKLLDMPFDLQLQLQVVDQFLENMVKNKLQYWSSTNLLLTWQTLIVNWVLMSSLWNTIIVWARSKRVIGRIKFLLCNYLWYGSENMARARVGWDDCTARCQK